MGIIADLHAVLCGDDVPSGQSDRKLLEVAKLYSELLYSVERAFPGESRHQTALRYIQEAERRATQGPAQEAKPAPAAERCECPEGPRLIEACLVRPPRCERCGKPSAPAEKGEGK